VLVVLNPGGWVKVFVDRERAARFLRSLGPWGFAGFVLLQVVQVVAAPIPGEVVGLLGGYLYGPYVGTVLSTIGLTLGSFIAFAIARTLGRPVVERFVDPKAIARFDFLLRPQGSLLILLLFVIPGFPKDYLCYVLGLGHLSVLRFVVVSGAGRLVGTAMLTFGGALLRREQFGKLFVLAGLALVATVIALAYRDRLERWLKAHSTNR
jgi:uncharacterized membrane protein YdjX (TVP38/TMEM64 family)